MIDKIIEEELKEIKRLTKKKTTDDKKITQLGLNYGYLSLDFREKEEKCYKEALKINPKNQTALHNLAFINLEKAKHLNKEGKKHKEHKNKALKLLKKIRKKPEYIKKLIKDFK